MEVSLFLSAVLFWRRRRRGERVRKGNGWFIGRRRKEGGKLFPKKTWEMATEKLNECSSSLCGKKLIWRHAVYIYLHIIRISGYLFALSLKPKFESKIIFHTENLAFSNLTFKKWAAKWKIITHLSLSLSILSTAVIPWPSEQNPWKLFLLPFTRSKSQSRP